MATQTNRSINIYIESGEAQKVLDRLQQKAKDLRAELEKTSDPKAAARLKTELSKLEEPLDRAEKKVSGKLAPSFRDLQNTVNSLGKRLKKLSTEDADYSKVLVQYNAAKVALKEQKKVIDQIKSANSGLKDVGIGSFLGGLAADALSNIISSLKDVGREAIEASLQAEGVKRAFDRLNEPGLLDNLRKATKGTVSDLELMKRAVQANNFNIPIGKLGTLLDFAQRRARETGENVDYLVNSIVTGIARKSPLILDNLDINIQRINERFKETGNFAQAAFDIVNEELEKAGPALETAADRVDRWKTRWTNATEQIASGLIDIAMKVADMFDLMVNRDVASAEQNMRDYIQRIARENENARQRELNVVKEYQEQLYTADKAGREKILRLAEQEAKILNDQQQVAANEGNKQLVRQLEIRLKVWRNFIKELKNTTGDGSDTIANLQKEIQATQDIRDNAIIGSKQFNEAKARLKELQDRLDQLLGNKKGGAASKNENVFKQYLQQIKDAISQAQLASADAEERELKQLQDKYTKQQELLKKSLEEQKLTTDQYYQLKVLSEEAQGKEELNILVRYADLRRKQLQQQAEQDAKAMAEAREKILRATADAAEKLALNAAQKAGGDIAEAQAAAELQVLKSKGRSKLNAQLDQLDLEEQVAVAGAKGREEQIALIEEQFRQKRQKAEQDYWKSIAEAIIGFAQNIIGTWQQVADLQTQTENQQLADDKAANDRKKENWQRQLNSKFISQEEFNKKVSALDKQQEQKEKAIRIRQFQRDKDLAFANASINLAAAIVKALPDVVLVAITSAIGAIQLGLIAGKQPPKFAKGGIVPGLLHSEGGMPVIDPRTGRPVANIERGEAILSRNTVRNNPELTNALLYSSMHRNGAKISPEWMNRVPTGINMPAINRASQIVRVYEKGGVFGAQSKQADNEIFQNLSQSLDFLNAQLASGITAYTLLTDNEKQQARLNRIRSDAFMS